MALGFNTTVKNARLVAISTAADLGTGAAKIIVYSGTKPAPGKAATTALATLTMSDPAFLAPSNGVMSASTIPPVAITASGVASWFRLTDSTGLWICDGTVGTTVSFDMRVPTTTFTAGITLNVTDFTLTDGN